MAFDCSHSLYYQGLWIQSEVIRTEWTKSVTDYAICLFNPPTGDSIDCKPQQRLNVVGVKTSPFRRISLIFFNLAGIVLGWSTAISGVAVPDIRYSTRIKVEYSTCV